MLEDETGSSAAAAASTAGAAEPSAKLLIVDDIADNRAVLGRRFERRGYQVAYAEGGVQALEMIRAEPFDLVLLDWMMADMEGIEVLKRIRADSTAVSLPVIMATARTQSEDVVEALAHGANDYITKPVDFSVALARVSAQIDRKRAHEQLHAANAALAGANDELERRIAQRTAELVATNARLELTLEEARAAERAKDEFLSNMSHELRTPLNGVVGMAQAMQTTPLTPAQQQMLAVIGASAATLGDLIGNLLEVVELGSRAVVLNPTRCRLDAVIGAVAEPARLKAERKALSFATDIAADAAGEVLVDAERLGQILAHLLDNAVKFTECGAVSLSVRRLAADAERVVFEVKDTGVGFDPAIAEDLFQRFRQADGSNTRAQGGAGLGLAISRELVAHMGGAIRAEGRPGQGAVFQVELDLPSL